MSRLAFCMVAALLAASAANAKSIKWTGYAKNGQWETATNWYPADLPGPSDDVTINSGGNVTITTPVTVSSISIGDTVGEYPFLIVDSSLIVESTLDVKGNGGIVMNSGAAMISGQVTVGGTFVFQSGTISGSWLIASPGKTSWAGAAEKAFSNAQVTVSVDIDIGGLVILNQSSVITLSSGNTMTAAGAFSVQAGDSTPVKFDTSAGTLIYNGGVAPNGVMQMMAPWSVGAFTLNAGNLTLFDSVTFKNSFNVPAGSVVKSLGVAEIVISAGVTGSGLISAEGKSFVVGGVNFTSGLVNAVAGTFECNNASTIGTLSVAGASIVVNAPLSVNQISLTAGKITGPSGLTVASGSLQSAGFNINATTVINGPFTATGSVIAFGQMGGISIASGATFTTVDAVVFSGPPGTAGVTNAGMINAKGALSLTNIDLKGAGSVTVADTFTVGTITIAQSVVALTGNGKFIGSTTEITSIGQITGTPGVTGTIGSYSFTCDKACKTISTTGIPTNKFIFAVSA